MGEDTITITSSSDSDSYVINLNDTYGTTTTYLDTGYITTDTGAVGSYYSINASGNVGIGTISTISPNVFMGQDDNTHLDVAEVEKMCVEYPALAKVYENFKTVYDLVKQDWKGKLDAETNS